MTRKRQPPDTQASVEGLPGMFHAAEVSPAYATRSAVALVAERLMQHSLALSEALAQPETDAVQQRLAQMQTLLHEIATLHRAARGAAPRPRLFTGGSGSFLDALRDELARCRSASLAVAFVLSSGLRLLEGPLRAALLRGARVRLLTTDYLDTTEPEALRTLLAIPGPLDVRVYSNPARSFHPKAYWFDHGKGTGRAFIGSANLSASGLRDGVEWSWAVMDFDAGHPMAELRSAFDALFEDPHTVALSPGWIDAYAARRSPRPFTSAAEPAPAIAPRPVQELALRELDRLRADGADRALVVAATGLGKTFLAAFDAAPFRRSLFIAHREELLAQAKAAYRAVHPARSVGTIQGQRVEADRDMVFATIQTLSRKAVLRKMAPGSFDHVVVDEFHHAAADTYRRVIEHLAPSFLLGLTATPFRADNRDVHALCNDNVACQVGLFEAIAMGWLCPFQYFGIADTAEYDDTLLNASRTGYDAGRLTVRFNTPERVALVVRKYRAHRSRAALGFCVSIEHAEFMAKAFNAAGIAALAVHSSRGGNPRQDAIERLVSGRVEILFTVDLFNEGVDIPCVDLVLFLRPTESMTVFVQQLGRGLRVLPGKSRLTVLDFIGNHRGASFKLPFLAGVEDTSPGAQRDALRALTAAGGALRGEPLPPGVEVHLQPVALQALREAFSVTQRLKEALRDSWRELREALGRRPTMLEAEVRGRLPVRLFLREFDGWANTLRSFDALSDAEEVVERECGAFLRYLEKTPMTRSFKMVVLQAMFDGDRFRRLAAAHQLIRHFRTHFSQERYRGDIEGSEVQEIGTVDDATVLRYLLKNPVNALVGGNRRESSAWFRWVEAQSAFEYTGPWPAHEAEFSQAVRERVAYRLHAYLKRPGPGSGIYSVVPSGERVCIIYGEEAPLPRGWQTVRMNGRYFYGNFVKVALNVLQELPPGNTEAENVLTRELQVLFGGVAVEGLRSGRRVRVFRVPGEGGVGIAQSGL